MNGASGVEKSAHSATDAPAFDVEAETVKIVAETVVNMSRPDVVQKGEIPT
jgi:hypothetical protein